MNVLVTGNLGYIGPVLTSLLNKHNFNTTGLDTNYFFTNKKNFKKEHYPNHQIILDIRNIDTSVFEKIDIVIHLSALSNDPMGQLDYKLTNEINFLASKKLAKFAKQSGVKKFIFFSSCSIYGTSKESQMVDEKSEFKPLSEYAKSKVNFENYLKSIANENFKCIFLRNATAYGVSPNMRFDLVLNNLFAWAYFVNEIKILSDGKPIRPLVHIEDISKCALFFCNNDIFDNFLDLNVGSNSENFTVKEIAILIRNIIRTAEINILGKNENDQRSYKVNFTKLNNILDFKLQWNVEKGCDELYKWFKSYNGNVKEIFSNDFIRLEQIKYILKNKLVNKKLFWM